MIARDIASIRMWGRGLRPEGVTFQLFYQILMNLVSKQIAEIFVLIRSLLPQISINDISNN